MQGTIIFSKGLLIAIFIFGCTQIPDWATPLMGEQEQIVSCAGEIVDVAYELHEEAKLELARYYDTRDTNHLFNAYYAAADSSVLSRSLSKCPDRQRSDFFAMRNLISLNRSIQQVVQLNMRDEDPSDLIAIYRDQYYKVMPNDIE